jgi:hypothetical protein
MAIPFEREFRKGSASYESQLAQWWIDRSQDEAHRAAHQNVVRFMRRFFTARGMPQPRMIVDYACGNGSLIGLLARRFPMSGILALDGSRRMLTHAKRSLQESGLFAEMGDSRFSTNGSRVQLIHTPLPNFALPAIKADAVIFLFPNMTISKKERQALRKRVPAPRTVLKAARLVSHLVEMDTGDSSEETFQDLLDARAIAINIRGLLKRGGYWFEIDYANARREQWDPVDERRTMFEECAWEGSVDGQRLERHFTLLQSSYYRSSVVLDVYEQSGDPDDREGGYAISVLRAI